MIECLRFNQINKHTCLGFADVKVVKWGLIINGISLHSKDGRKWVSLPSKMYEKEGDKKWMPYIKMENPEYQKEFLKQIQEAIEKKMSEQMAQQVNSRVNELDNFTSDFINF